MIGDKKIDSVFAKVKTTSAYFASRTLIYRLNLILGLLRPLARFSAAVIASFLSEQTKAKDRQQRSLGEKLEIPEIVSDVVKWLVYDALDDSNWLDNQINPILLSFLFGGISAIVGTIACDISIATSAKQHSKAELLTSKRKLRTYSQAVLEGGVLFGCYESIVELLDLIYPQSLSTKFLFDQIIETLEKDILEAEDGVDPLI